MKLSRGATVDGTKQCSTMGTRTFINWPFHFPVTIA